jgi:uridine kinase
VLVDGASGTGKTSLAAELAARWPTGRQVIVVHMDDLYGGWDGLAAGILALEVSLLTPRSRGEAAHLGSYNWLTESWDDGQIIPAHVDVIVEGCGSFGPFLAQTADARIWLEAPEDLRRQRALGRGAEDFERHWDVWEQQFQQFERRVQPSALASLRVQSNH